MAEGLFDWLELAMRRISQLAQLATAAIPKTTTTDIPSGSEICNGRFLR